MLEKKTKISIKSELSSDIDKLISKKIKPDHSKSNLIDLSYLKTYTIDDSDTLEIDDAISLERIDDNYKVWIHISSPAVYIKYDSNVDKSARSLISSKYLVKKNNYMLPEILISELFSLTSIEKRFSISLGVIFNNDSSIYSSEIVLSLIKPNYKLSYDDADELIDYAPKEEEDLSIIYKILEKRKYIRKRRGSIEIIEPYGKISLKDNIPIIKVIHQTKSRELISEAMILYGDLLSNFTKKNNIPVPYRVQEGKSNGSINNQSNSNNLILKNFQLKKNMGKTYYSILPLKHKSLGLDCYLQATSPIRRYSDLLVHYQIYRYLNNEILISEEEIQENIININNIGRQNIEHCREDQKYWLNKWFENNKIYEFRVVLLNWINRYKNICLVYFIEYNISSICFLQIKPDLKIGDEFVVKNITTNYDELLYFKLI